MREHYNHSRRRVLRRRRMLVAAAAVLLVAAVIFAVVHWVIPALNKEINPPDPTPTPGPVTDPTTDPSATGDVTPTPNPDGDDVVFNPGPVVPESQQVSEKWFDDAVILGDSRSQGLILYNSLSNCTSLAVKSLSLTNYTKKEATLPGLGTDTVANLIPQVGGKRFYLVFGMNDMGLSADTFGQYFSRLVDLIQKSHPDADIYAQAVLPVTELKEQSGAANGFSLAHVKEFNEQLMKICTEKQVWYVDIPPALVDGKGYLLDEASWDGVHLNAEYCRDWMNYLLCHVVLPEDYNGEYDVPTGYHPGDVVVDGVTVYDFKPSN